MAQVLNTIALVCLSLFVIGIGVSIYIWIKLDIYKVWCDLTGKTEQKALEEIQKQKTSNIRRLKLTDAISERASNEDLEKIWSESRVLSRTDDIHYFTEGETNQIASSELETEIITEKDETEVLMGTISNCLDLEVSERVYYPLTEIVSENETEMLSEIDPKSEVLSVSAVEKMPLYSEYLGSGNTMEIDNTATDNKKEERELSSHTFKLIEKRKQIDTTNRII